MIAMPSKIRFSCVLPSGVVVRSRMAGIRPFAWFHVSTCASETPPHTTLHSQIHPSYPFLYFNPQLEADTKEELESEFAGQIEAKDLRVSRAEMKREELRLIFRYHSSFCVFLEISTCVTSYSSPSSSSVIETFCPLGVPAVYNLQIHISTNSIKP